LPPDWGTLQKMSSGEAVAHIILISDQERLIQILTSPGFVPGATVHAARTIEQALEMLAHGRYRFVLIQERLGELSGRIVAHRMAAEPTARQTRVIMLGGDDRDAGHSGKQLHTIHCTGLSEEEIAATAREYLAAQERTSKRRRIKPRDQAADRVAIPPPSVETVDDMVKIGRASAQPAGGPAAKKTSDDSAGSEPAKSRFQEKLDSMLDETADTARPTQPQQAAEYRAGRPAPLLVTWGKAPLVERICKRFAGRKPRAMLLAAAVIAVIMAGATATLRNRDSGFSMSGRKSAAPGTPKTPAESLAPGRGLSAVPSFIPQSSLDTAYGKNHPGWVRYQTAATEFRVYRQGGAIRAIQIIDRSGKGVPPGLFTSALNEIASSRHYLVEGKERKGSFLIEKGQLAQGAKIIVYRHMPDSRVNALVIDMH
jgi:hypothetical protein